MMPSIKKDKRLMNHDPSRIGLTACLLAALLLASGCTTNMFKKGAGGAMVGAASASFVGAMTDLILDGSVNTSRLERNLVSGAMAGGTAGAVVGHQQDAAAKQTQQAKAAAAAPPDQAMIQKIGQDNYNALNDLLHYRHEDAYRKAMKAGSKGNPTQQEASYVVQALIDKDRGNADGVTESIAQFLELNDTVNNEKDALKGLDQLYGELQDERKISGIRKP